MNEPSGTKLTRQLQWKFVGQEAKHLACVTSCLCCGNELRSIGMEIFDAPRTTGALKVCEVYYQDCLSNEGME